MTAPYGRPPADQTTFAAGYQAALNDIARQALDTGEPGVLRWLEANVQDAPTRILISARLIKLDNPFWDRM